MTKHELRSQANESARAIHERLANPAKLTASEIGELLGHSWRLCAAILALQCRVKGSRGDYA